MNARPHLFAFACTLGLLLGGTALRAQETILIDNKPCDMHGSARQGTKEYDQNPLKNRFNDPPQVQVVPMDELVNGSATSGRYSTDMAVELVGYVEKVSNNSVESCNCKATDSYYKDTHIELTPGPDRTGPRYRISVEVTPRLRMIMNDKYGEDWTTATLKKKLLGRMVRVQGWLFYDNSHESADFANDPDDAHGEANRRASSWEVHPATFLEVLEEEYADGGAVGEEEDGIGTSGPITYPPPPQRIIQAPPPMSPAERTPSEWLDIILLAVILGIVGQLIRAVVGLSKVNAKVAAGEAGAGFRTSELTFSLLISVAVGAVAGVLAAVSAGDWKGGEMITAFIAAGYAGTDFIEGWMKKGAGGSTTTPPADVPSGAVPITTPLRPAPAMNPPAI